MFKPGQSGNPNGAPKVPADLVAARKITRQQFELTANKYLSMSVSELSKLDKHKGDITLLEAMIISVIQQGIKKGDHVRLDFLLDRLIGKVVQPFEYVPPPPPVVIQFDVSSLPTHILRQLSEATEKDVTPKAE